jgi:hypothetical protein
MERCSSAGASPSFVFRLGGSWDAEHIDNAHLFLREVDDDDDARALMEKALMGPSSLWLAHNETNPAIAEPEEPLPPPVGGAQGTEGDPLRPSAGGVQGAGAKTAKRKRENETIENVEESRNPGLIESDLGWLPAVTQQRGSRMGPVQPDPYRAGG